MHCSAAFEVPFALLTLVEKDTAVKKWLINSLHVTHMTDGAPIVKISAANPVQGIFQGPDFLIDMFNNPKRHPDLIISVNSQDILVHKCIVASGSDVLDRQWDPLWLQGNSSYTSRWDFDSTACSPCGVNTSYSTALMCFSFFYTGEVKWPQKEADAPSALELLVLASLYNVPFLLQAAEVALKNRINNSNCFTFLTVADHHDAQQLRKFSLHYIANGFKLLSKSAQYSELSREFQAELQQMREALQ